MVRKIICHQQFVGRVLQWPRMFGKQTAVESYFRGGEVARAHSLVWSWANGVAGKIENEFVILAKEFPDRARVKYGRAGTCFQLVVPSAGDFDVSIVVGHAKGFKLGP